MEEITFKIQVKAGTTATIVNDLADMYGWTASLGVTKAEFVRKQISQYIKSQLLTYRSQKAAREKVTEVNALEIN